MKIEEVEEFFAKYISFNVSRETLKLLYQYENELKKWTSKINLISPTTISDIWKRHILDSAQLLRYIPTTDVVLCDLGSGSGLPGLILSYLGIEEVNLIESDKRKAVFLSELSKISAKKVHVYNERVEKLAKINCNIITARAFAPLKDILNYLNKFHNKQNIKKCLFLKGKNINKEIEESKLKWILEFELHKSLTDDEGYILELYNFRKKVD